MTDLYYHITGPSIDGKYGIAVVDIINKHNAVTMYFIKDWVTVEYLVHRLNERQLPISEFCKVFSIGKIADIIQISNNDNNANT